MNMQSLELLDEHKKMHPAKFWERQFSLEPTRKQVRFDWAYGVVLPIVCVAADPIVFRGGFEPGDALLGKFKIFAYALSSVSIMAMAAWLLWGHRLGELRPFLGGLFIVAAAVSTLVGIVLFPFSLLGMFLLVGFLGFTPLFAGFVFFRNAIRAFDGSTDDMPRPYVARAAALAALFALVVPYVLNS